MVLKKILPIFVFSFSMIIPVFCASAAEEEAAAEQSSVSAESQPAALEDTNTQWAWGEVVNIDGAGKTVTLRYLDYETDQEKDIDISVDGNTSFENIDGFDDIKVKDTLSIDYTPGPDGKNIARDIGLENTDSSSAAPAQTVDDDKQAVSSEAAAEPDQEAGEPSSGDSAVSSNDALEPSEQEKI